MEKIQKQLKLQTGISSINNSNSNSRNNNSKLIKVNSDLSGMSNNNTTSLNKNSNNKSNGFNSKVSHSLSIGNISMGKISSSSSSSSSTSSSSSSSSASKKQLSTEDKKINLNALKNQDPFATNIIDTALRVAVYKFVSKKNEWKKLEVEGSLFLFERMVEPLHSFVVMNTLALHLFLQPITADLEFQDRNPFLLYKSNNDIFGIWFIDRDDCDRVKTSIMGLTENARDRKAKREQSKNQLQEIPRLVTPTALLDTASHSSPIVNNNAYEKLFAFHKSSQQAASEPAESNDKKKCDIMQMLNKAQVEYNQLKAVNLVSQAPVSPKPILDQLPGDMLLAKPEALQAVSLNTSSCLSSSPSTSSTSTGYSTSSSAGNVQAANEKINPMIQKLLGSQLPHTLNTKTLDEIESEIMIAAPVASNAVPATHDSLSEELKKKLNIKCNKVPLASSSMIKTPSNPLVLSGCGGIDSAALKGPITLKDFEENLLNESTASTTSTPANSTTQQQQKPVFYLSNGVESTVVVDNSNYIRPNQLSFINKKSEKTGGSSKGKDSKSKKSTTTGYNSSKYSSSDAASQASTLSSRSSRSSTSDSSTDSSSDTSSTASSSSSSPRTLPLLLTPAAFETSSISSSTGSTSSSSKANIFNDFLNSQLLSSIDHQQKMAQKLMKKTHHHNQQLPKTSTHTSSTATSSFNNLLLANVEQIESVGVVSASADLPKISKHMQQQHTTVLNKPQLQQTLIHLLTTDDKFLSSLHQAYLEANFAQVNQSNKA